MRERERSPLHDLTGPKSGTHQGARAWQSRMVFFLGDWKMARKLGNYSNNYS